MKIAICDFELKTLDIIKAFVAKIDNLWELPFKILSYENPFDMLAYYSRYKDIDIILLNVEMQSGYDVFNDLLRISTSEDVSFNQLVLQCCRYALDNYEGNKNNKR